MIPVLNILQGIDDRLNKNSSLQGQFIPRETKLLEANKAQIKLGFFYSCLSFNTHLSLPQSQSLKYPLALQFSDSERFGS